MPSLRARPRFARFFTGIPLASLAAVLLLSCLIGAIASDVPAGAVAPPTPGWTTTQAPLPADAGTGAADPSVYTASSTCPAANACVTVGWYNDTSGQTWGMVETQNGTTWNDTEAPQPSNAGAGADQGFWFGSQDCGFDAPCRAVSCPSTTACVAVGQYMDSSGFLQPVVDTLANGTWSSQEGALPADAATDTTPTHPQDYLYSVSCSTATSCVAVGQYTNTSGDQVAYISTLANGSWSAMAAPQPADAATGSPDSFLFGVSCASPAVCVATGQYTSTTTSTAGLLEVLSNGSWTGLRAPEPSNDDTSGGGFGIVIQVACPTTSTCVAVGSYDIQGGGGSPLIDTWNGSTWSSIEGPLPADANTADGGQLLAVSCGSPTSCAAVGGYDYGPTPNEAGLIDTLSGGTWTATRAPVPADATAGTNAFANLNEVACSAPSFCLSVGSYDEVPGNIAGVVDSLNQGTWSAMAAPLPADANADPANSSSQGRTVACDSPVACVVGGLYVDSSTNTQGFLDTDTGVQGYWLGASDGGIFNYGNTSFKGSAGALKLNSPVVGMAPTADGGGYWLVASDGGIFDYGDAGFFGSAGSIHLNKPVVGMAATPDGKGYWLVASDGGIFSYGDAQYFGSRGGQPLNKPIVGMATTADGKGYWLVASDGGIFNYGDAGFLGSTGALHLNKPVVGMASTPDGLGYWLVASDGGIFNYGDAAFDGSAGSLTLNKPVVGMASSPSGKGYWLVASDGGIFTYGDAAFYGSAGSIHLNKPVVGMAG
jgi:hypothetical protein